MIVVIQCAGSKRKNACTLRTNNGKPVKFVARPDLAPKDGINYAHPDDLSDQNISWRQLLIQYNEYDYGNPFNLLPACELYTPDIYQKLAGEFGRQRLFILSAGWGLIRADYLIPDYDITFSNAVRKKAPYKKRRKGDNYADINMLPQDTMEPIFYFGGNDYLQQFLALTGELNAQRTVFHASAKTPDVPGCIPIRFETNQRTNWHYSCAAAFLDEL